MGFVHYRRCQRCTGKPKRIEVDPIFRTKRPPDARTVASPLSQFATEPKKLSDFDKSCKSFRAQREAGLDRMPSVATTAFPQTPAEIPPS
jgi:hypothetical protein